MQNPAFLSRYVDIVAACGSESVRFGVRSTWVCVDVGQEDQSYKEEKSRTCSTLLAVLLLMKVCCAGRLQGDVLPSEQKLASNFIHL